jgi:RNA polymerase sigma-70 factor (ECF subfamily)
MITFDLVYEKYYNHLHTIIKENVKNENNLQDIINDVFVHINNVLHINNNKNGNILNWLSVITKNKTLDLKRKKKNVFSFVSMDEIENEPSYEQCYENDDYNNHMIDMIMNMLSSEENRILTMFYYNGDTLKEIAKKLKLPEDSIKVKLFRLRKKVQKAFNCNLF